MLTVNQTRYSIALLAFFLLLSAWLYWQGIGGPFLLDDGANLSRLPVVTQVPGVGGYLIYVFDGVASSLGRPVSLLSFSLQAESWPDNPGAFKAVNIGIHLLNGVLVFMLLRMLLAVATQNLVRSEMIALIVAVVWLIHPIHVSTVLYTVQRMTELSTFFVLLSLIVYLYGRQLLLLGRRRMAFSLMTVAVFLGGTLAVLSKENGALLPLFVLLMEWLLLPKKRDDKAWCYWKYLCLYFPALCLIVYLLAGIPGYINGGFQLREYSMGERLFTQFHVLAEYLQKLLIPLPGVYGLYHDDFSVARSIAAPGALIGLLIMLLLIGGAIIYRRRYKVLAFAVLWFYLGHSLESSFLPLELYFEHRNYLPSIGVLLAVVWLAADLYDRVERREFKAVLRICGLIALLLPASSTLAQTTIWGEEAKLTLYWAEDKPLSKRAQATAADMMFRIGDYDSTLMYVDRLSPLVPNDPVPDLMRLNVACMTGAGSLEVDALLKDVMAVAREATYSLGTINKLRQLVSLVLDGKCQQQVSAQDVSDLIQVLFNNPQYKALRSNLLQIEARVYAANENYARAAELCRSALALGAQVELALRCVRLLAMSQQLLEAKSLLRSIEQQHASDWVYQLHWRFKVDEWREFFKRQEQSING